MRTEFWWETGVTHGVHVRIAINDSERTGMERRGVGSAG